MTYEEAIKAMKNIVEYWTYRPTEVEAAKLAIEALEKQIPKKPIEKKVYMWEWTCPTCNSCYVAKAGQTTIACENCGQAIRLE